MTINDWWRDRTEERYWMIAPSGGIIGDALSAPKASPDRRFEWSHELVGYTEPGDTLFVWDRPLRGADLAALGPAAPTGPVLGVRVADLGAKEALLAGEPTTCFTIPHLDGYPAVLVRLDHLAAPLLDELVVEAWLARAPSALRRAYLDRARPDPA